MIIVPSLSATLIQHDGLTIIASIQHQLVIGDRAFNVPGFDSDTLRVIRHNRVCDQHGNVIKLQNRGHDNGYRVYYNGRYLISVTR